MLTWGSSACGQLGHGDLLNSHAPRPVETLSGKEVVSVACGLAHTAALVNLDTGGRKLAGRLWTWGCGVPATGEEGAAHVTSPR